MEQNKKYYEPKPKQEVQAEEKDALKTLKRIGGGYVKEVKRDISTS